MTAWTLIRRSLRFHARSHLGVLLGAAIGSAALVGALVVGDSVRESLHEMALARLGHTTAAISAGDRLFRAQLAADLATPDAHTAALLQLPGTAVAEDGTARANHIQILGVDKDFWQLANQSPVFPEISTDFVVLNQALARQMHAGVGDTILLRVQKPSLLSRDAPISPQSDLSIAWRVKVQSIVTDGQFGRFSLQANQIAPFNAFVNLTQLQQKIEEADRANLLLLDDSQSSTTNRDNLLSTHWQLADAELDLRELPEHRGVELRSSRVFLDPVVVADARQDAQPVITYLVNNLSSPPFATPYSMVTAIGAPIVPAGMRDDEILINDWLTQDLQAKPGDSLSLSYYVIGNGRALEERQQNFHVRGTVPLTGAAADRGLMPDFPGLAQADSTSDWDAGFTIQLSRIRPKDEQYWKQYRGTPKAFVTLAAGEKMWANRFGTFTALRFPSSAGSLETIRVELLKKLKPASVGLSFQPVRDQALAASSQAVDFGGLFIGFSFFLIVAALLLMGLLFQFGLEQRAPEIGTLLALGFRAKQVRRLFLAEGALLALIGGLVGMVGGIGYARAMLLGLTTIWRHAVGTPSLHYHATAISLTIGAVSSTAVGILTIWLTLRRQGRQPVRELLAGEIAEAGAIKKFRRFNLGLWLGIVCFLFAVATIGWAIQQGQIADADTFFSAGALVLIAGLGFCSAWLKRLAQRGDTRLTLASLGLRNCGRRRKRSLATISLLASGIFIIMAIGAFRQDANSDGYLRSSGTGGFLLIGETALPVTYDLNSKAGRDFYNLDPAIARDLRVIPFRVHDGDEASCLNLNHAQTPRLLGVDPRLLAQRMAFTFAESIKIDSTNNAWDLLNPTNLGVSGDEIPAIGDQNSILWALGKKVGDTVDYTDEHGRAFKLRLVAAVANSILQGSLIIDESAFLKCFPSESGYRYFLFEAPLGQQAEISSLYTRALEDAGMEITPAIQRLNAFNAVQNTYLNTFQVLGGLGLLLGSVGLGIVVLRNVQERRAELALLLAIGWPRKKLRRLILGEHAALLALGLFVGVLAAAVGVMPTLLTPGMKIPWLSLALTAGAVFLNGLIWTWLATWFALRGKLLAALRNE